MLLFFLLFPNVFKSKYSAIVFSFNHAQDLSSVLMSQRYLQRQYLNLSNFPQELLSTAS